MDGMLFYGLAWPTLVNSEWSGAFLEWRDMLAY